jgi:CheY-like chemotaxis protein
MNAILTVLANRSDREERRPFVARNPLREGPRRLRVLLAEDNAVNQKLALRLLEKQGHTVTVAGDGREALAMLERSAFDGFDLVLMDVQMPEIDGFKATAMIREKEKTVGKHVPIVAMTARAMKGDRERCLAAGMDGYVAKPIRVEDLFAAIKRVFQSSSGTEPAVHNNGEPVVDWSEALARVEGDELLLGDLARLFLNDCPKLLAALHEAVSRQDAKSLQQVAHALKGSVGNFAARGAYDAAAKLEEIGTEGNLTRAAQAYVELEDEIEKLRSALADS